MAPQLSPPGPGQREKANLTGYAAPGALDHTAEAPSLFALAPPLGRGRSSGAGGLSDKLEGAQPCRMLVDVGDDDQFVGPGFGDQRFHAGANRLGRTDDGAGEHPARLRSFELIAEAAGAARTAPP